MREESKDPAELTAGFATGFLDFARNDAGIERVVNRERAPTPRMR
jgi:hypothetical protein